jgi:hypothetical protein
MPFSWRRIAVPFRQEPECHNVTGVVCRRLFYHLYRKKSPKNEAQAWGNFRYLHGRRRVQSGEARSLTSGRSLADRVGSVNSEDLTGHLFVDQHRRNPSLSQNEIVKLPERILLSELGLIQVPDH